MNYPIGEQADETRCDLRNDDDLERRRHPRSAIADADAKRYPG
jgi:hypothetical protein